MLSACDNPNTKPPVITVPPAKSPEASQEPTVQPTQSPELPDVTDFKIEYDSDGNIDYEATWPDKTILVWAHSDYLRLIDNYFNKLSGSNASPMYKYRGGINDYIVAAYNNYLISKGCDYVVKFINEMDMFDQIREEYVNKILVSPSQLFKYYQPWLRDLKANNRQVDIISLGTPTRYTDTDENSPTFGEEIICSLAPDLEAIEDGLVMDINEYIFNEKDTRLYNAFPEYVWDLTSIDDKVYGLYNHSYASRSLIKFNETIMEELGLKAEDVNTLEKIDSVLSMVYESKADEIGKDSFRLIFNNLTQGSVNIMAEIYADENNITYKYDNKNKAYASNKLNDKMYLDFIEHMAKWNEKGYFGREYVHQGPMDEATSQIKISGQWFMDIDRESLTLSNKANAVCVSVSDWIFNDNFTNMISISSWSKNADMAFDLLSRVFTDQYLSNLIIYGVGYEDYADEEIVSVEKVSNIDSIGTAVMVFVKPRNDTEYLVEEKLDIIAKLNPPAYLRFVPDMSGFEYDLERFNELLLEADNLWHTHPDNFLTKLDEIKAKLESIGYSDFIQEINEQFDNYLDNFTHLNSSK